MTQKIRGIQKDTVLADRLEDLLASLRRSSTWLEAAGREGLMEQLDERLDNMGRQRTLETVLRLYGLCEAFLRNAQVEYEMNSRCSHLTTGIESKEAPHA